MKCLSRSTLGVIIGFIDICFSAILIIYIIAILCEANTLSEEEMRVKVKFLTTSIALLYITLIVCVISLITSVFLILGILKQRHTFMKPWICSAIIGISYYILGIIIEIIIGLTNSVPFGTIMAILLVGLLTLGLQLLIFYPIYTLYADFRDAINAQEQRGLNYCSENPPIYGE